LAFVILFVYVLYLLMIDHCCPRGYEHGNAVDSHCYHSCGIPWR